MNRFEKSILRNLLLNNNSIDKDTLLNGYPDDHRSNIIRSLCILQDLGYIYINIIDNSVTLSQIRVHDAFKIVNPSSKFNNSVLSKSEYIPKQYLNQPFLISKGEKEIKGKVSEYWFCKNRRDEESITCFVFNQQGITLSITLGKLSDGNSFISRGLRAIDGIFGGSDYFTKSDLTHKLPFEIVGNRQPIKAITEYLCYEKYLVKIDKSKFRRTGKRHLFTIIENKNLLKFIENSDKIKDITFNFQGTKYNFTEEFGLYPTFY